MHWKNMRRRWSWERFIGGMTVFALGGIGVFVMSAVDEGVLPSFAGEVMRWVVISAVFAFFALIVAAKMSRE